jgi:hypothetical protein
MTDLLFSTNFMEFLSDGTRVVDITSPAARKLCDEGNSDDQQCKLRYYVAGGVENFAPRLLAAGKSEADAFLAEVGFNRHYILCKLTLVRINKVTYSNTKTAATSGNTRLPINVLSSALK